MTTKRVLSIQSHVVHGYVGNKSATFPLEVLGFEVDAINAVQFSNHTGYSVFKGQVLQEKELIELIEGLDKNDLLKHYSHLLTGYIGNVSFLEQIAVVLKKLRAKNPKLIYVCDPVMGDNGVMYVPKELLPIYRDNIVPLANIVTPNQYEAELLTEMKITNVKEAWQATKWFHDKNVETVVLSSSNLGDQNELLAFLSQKNGLRYILKIPKQGDGIQFTGTGDLFAALFLAHSYETKDFSQAMENTIATVQAVIKRTIESIPIECLNGTRKVTANECELKLIQSKDDIEKPQATIKAKQID